MSGKEVKNAQIRRTRQEATERKRRAAAEAYVLIRQWQKRIPDAKDTALINLASQLYEAATGKIGMQANCEGQCATFVKQIERANDPVTKLRELM